MTLPTKTTGTITTCAPDNPIAQRHNMQPFRVTNDRLVIKRCRRCGHDEAFIGGKRVYFENEVAALVAEATAALQAELEQFRSGQSTL